MNSIVYVGMDVHKESYTLCCYCYDTDKVEYKQTILSDYKLILKYMESMRNVYGENVTFVCGYEAGCLGYSLYHQLREHAVDCKILALTTMAITNTSRVKTDKRDAANIARCLVLHTYSEVYVPDDEDNSVKEYIRMRDDQKLIWECVQLEIKCRKKYLEEHGTNSYSHRPESNPFASKIICGDCNKVFARKGWWSSTGVDRKVWQCSERYKVKGVMGCTNRHVEEETLIKAYLMAWNALVDNRADFMEQWTEQLQSENLLEGYRAQKFIEYTDGAETLTEMDTDFMLKTLDHIKVFEDGTLLVVFLDGTEIECKNTSDEK